MYNLSGNLYNFADILSRQTRVAKLMKLMTRIAREKVTSARNRSGNSCPNEFVLLFVTLAQIAALWLPFATIRQWQS